VQVDFSRLGELRGLPVPTAAGTIVPMGGPSSISSSSASGSSGGGGSSSSNFFNDLIHSSNSSSAGVAGGSGVGPAAGVLLVLPPSCRQWSASQPLFKHHGDVPTSSSSATAAGASHGSFQDLLPRRAAAELLHPDVVAMLLQPRAPPAVEGALAVAGVGSSGCMTPGMHGGSSIDSIGAAGLGISLLKVPEVRAAMGLRMFSFKDLSRFLGELLPSSWYQSPHVLCSPASGWELPGAAPLDPIQATDARAAAVSAVLHRQAHVGGAPSQKRAESAGLGVLWRNGHASSPSPQLVHQILGLTAGLVDAAPAWQAPEVRLSDLDGWPLLPTLGGERLMYVAHRALCIALPSDQLRSKDSKVPQQQQQQQQQPAQDEEEDPWFSLTAVPKGSQQQRLHQEQLQQEKQQSDDLPRLEDLVLPEPWPMLARALATAGCPILDPRFSKLSQLCVPHVDVGATATVLCRKLRWTAEALQAKKLALLSQSDAQSEASQIGLRADLWDSNTRAALLSLLAQTMPRSASPDDVQFLRALPLYPCLAKGTCIPLDPPPPAGTEAELTAYAVVVQPPPDCTEMVAPSDVRIAPTVCPTSVLSHVPGLFEALPWRVQASLLEARPGLMQLYSTLNVATFSIATLLASVAVPLLHALPQPAKATVLDCIQSGWTSRNLALEQEPTLVESLQSCAFVTARTANGEDLSQLYRPSELYDPDHPLFSQVYADAEGAFPSAQFCTPAWLTVLRGCGLRTHVTSDIFIEAAQHVEARGLPLLPPPSPQAGLLTAKAQQVLTAGAALVAYLQANAHTLGGREFFMTAGQIAFVPATRGGVPGSSKAVPVLARFTESAAPKDWPLCWTVLPVLQQPTCSEGGGSGGVWLGLPTSATSAMRLRSPPPFAVVMEHLKTLGADDGEDTLASWPATGASSSDTAGPLTIEQAFCVILDHLAREGLSPSQLAQLKPVPLIPVANATRLVRCNCLFTRLKEDLAPFAFEVPAWASGALAGGEAAQRGKLLRALGAAETPDVQWLINCLWELRCSTSNAPLNVNQRTAVVRVLSALCGQAQQAQHTAAAARAVAEARAAGRLVVLDAFGRLVPPHTAVRHSMGGGGDGGGSGHKSGGSSSSSRLLGRIDTTLITFVHPRVPEECAEWLGCPALDDMVEEVADMQHTPTEIEQIGGLHISMARQLLASPAFTGAAFSAVMAHSRSVRGLQQMANQQVSSVLRSLSERLVFVHSLSTRCVLRSTQQDITRHATDPKASAAPHAVYEFQCCRSGKQYVALPPPGLSVGWLLSIVASRALGSPVVLPLQAFFEVPLERIQELQPILLPGGYDPALEAAGLAGVPGAPLLPSDAAHLQLRPLRRFCAGELVAYKRSNEGPHTPTAEAKGGASATAPVAATAATAAAARGQAGEGGVVLRYGRVASDTQPSASGTNPLSYVVVEVEPGRCSRLLSSHVYCFGSPQTHRDAEQGSRLDASHGSTPTNTPQQQQQYLQQLSTTPTSPATDKPAQQPAHAASAAAGALRPQVQPATAVGAGASADAAAAGAGDGVVGSGELIAAVRDMMAAAGLPLATDRQELLALAAGLREQLQAEQRRASAAAAAAATQEAELEGVRQSWQCKICFANDVDSAYVSCGHMVCSSCATGMQRCPVCRSRSSQLIRLYK